MRRQNGGGGGAGRPHAGRHRQKSRHQSGRRDYRPGHRRPQSRAGRLFHGARSGSPAGDRPAVGQLRIGRAISCGGGRGPARKGTSARLWHLCARARPLCTRRTGADPRRRRASHVGAARDQFGPDRSRLPAPRLFRRCRDIRSPDDRRPFDLRKAARLCDRRARRVGERRAGARGRRAYRRKTRTFRAQTGGRRMTMRGRMIWIAPLLAVSAPALAQQQPVETAIRAFETGLRPGVHVHGQPQVRWTLAERMAHYKVPGVSIAVIRDGRIAWARGYGVLQAGKPERVDTATLFSVGSLSKVATAAIALRLVDAGTLDLDRDVSAYLTRWTLPDRKSTRQNSSH